MQQEKQPATWQVHDPIAGEHICPTEEGGLARTLRVLGETRLAHALIGTLALFVVLLAAGVILSHVGSASPPADLLLAIAALINFLPIALGAVAHATEYALAHAQAVVERLARRDLNVSGTVGDVVIKRQLTKTNIPLDTISVDLDGELIEVPTRDFQIVVFSNDLSRARWLGKDDKSPAHPFTQYTNPRRYYDAMMKILDDDGRVKRGAGNTRILKDPPAATWAAMGFH